MAPGGKEAVVPQLSDGSRDRESRGWRTAIEQRAAVDRHAEQLFRALTPE
jgi:hypothetical protein